MRTIDQKFYVLRNAQDLARRQTQTTTVIKHTIQVLDPMGKDDSFQMNEQLLGRIRQNVMADVLGEIPVFEDARGRVCLTVYLGH